MREHRGQRWLPLMRRQGWTPSRVWSRAERAKTPASSHASYTACPDCCTDLEVPGAPGFCFASRGTDVAMAIQTRSGPRCRTCIYLSGQGLYANYLA